MAIDRVRVNEGSVKLLEFDIVNEADEAVSESSLTSAQLTLLDIETYAPGASPATGIINDRDAQDVLNDNNVTIDSEGHVVWTMQPEDNVIVTPRRQVERHRAQFSFAWDEGSFNVEIEIEVVNLRKAS